jgi:dTDP-4-dehydrorhamnose reductase
MMRVALIGTHGMLGKDLLPRLVGVFTCLPIGGRKDLDITKRDKVLAWLEEVRPALLINSAAFTDVDGCESRREWAMQVNGEGAGHLAEGCERVGARMIQISTDFVFDGQQKVPYREEAVPNPLSAYGASKLLGEKRVAERLERYLIVRTSWLYGLGGKNFVEAILGQAEKKAHLRVVSDQIGSPTYVPDLSRAILNLVNAHADGIVHVANSGECSWYDFARKILELSGRSHITVEPIASDELKRPARRPPHSVLSGERYYEITGEHMRAWEAGLKDYLKQRVKEGEYNVGE